MFIVIFVRRYFSPNFFLLLQQCEKVLGRKPFDRSTKVIPARVTSYGTTRAEIRWEDLPVWLLMKCMCFNATYDYNKVPWKPAPGRAKMLLSKVAELPKYSRFPDYLNFDEDDSHVADKILTLIYSGYYGRADLREAQRAAAVAQLSEEDRIAHKKLLDRLDADAEIAINDPDRIARCIAKNGRPPLKRSDARYFPQSFPLGHLVYNCGFDLELDFDDVNRGERISACSFFGSVLTTFGKQECIS